MKMGEILYDLHKFITIEKKLTKRGSTYMKVKIRGFDAEKVGDWKAKGVDSINIFYNEKGVSVSPQIYQYFMSGKKPNRKKLLAFRRYYHNLQFAFTKTGKSIVRQVVYKRKKRNPLIWSLKDKERINEVLREFMHQLCNEIQSEQFGYDFCIGLNKVSEYITQEILTLVNVHLIELKGKEHGHFYFTK